MAQVIFPCHVSQHYVVCRLILADHLLELYDPLHHNVAGEVALQLRLNQIAPLVRMVPPLLRQAGWYKSTPYEVARAHSTDSHLSLWIAPPERKFVQLDSISCGVFTAMMVERLISGSPNCQKWAQQNLAVYRKYMACSILDLCTLQY